MCLDVLEARNVRVRRSEQRAWLRREDACIAQDFDDGRERFGMVVIRRAAYPFPQVLARVRARSARPKRRPF